jgi:hypothetical protein
LVEYRGICWALVVHVKDLTASIVEEVAFRVASETSLADSRSTGRRKLPNGVSGDAVQLRTCGWIADIRRWNAQVDGSIRSYFRGNSVLTG